MDEAMALPTEGSVRTALRTQQIIAFESGVADVVDPIAGSYYVEALTQQIARRATELIAEVDAEGGGVAAIESGWMQSRIADSAYRAQLAIEEGKQIVVGVNAFTDRKDGAPVKLHRVDASLERDQVANVRRYRAERDESRVAPRLDDVLRAAEGTANLMPLFVEALDAGATLGEISNVLRGVFGRYTGGEVVV